MTHYCTCHLVQKALEENGAVDRQIGQAVRRLGDEHQTGWEDGYQQGVRDEATKTKNGVSRYQIGHNDGRAEAFAEVVVIVIQEMNEVSDQWGDPRRLGAHKALSDLLAKIASKKV